MTPQVPALPGMTPMGFKPTSIPSSTGGTISYTKTGLIHSAGKAYSGKIAQQEAKAGK
jgi:hypothetical protein